MATITGLTAARMLAIEAASVVSGTVTGGNLILTKKDGSTINAGAVVGATGATGAAGAAGASGSTWRVGSSEPPSNTLGANGDFYLCTTVTSGNYYEKVSGVYTLRGSLLGPTGPTGPTGPAGSSGGTSVLETAFPVSIGVGLSDEVSALPNTGLPVTRMKIRAPWAFTITDVRVGLNTADSATSITVDVLNGAGTTIFTTKPAITATNKTNIGVGTRGTLDSTKVNIAADEELSFQINAYTGTVARGLKIWVIGTRSTVSSVTVPSQPSAPTAARAGSGAIHLTWSAPFNGNDPITTYRIEGSSDNTTFNTVVASTTATYGSSTTLTTSGGAALTNIGPVATPVAMANGTQYYFRVVAINGTGASTPSPSVAITPAIAPQSAPSGLTPTAGNASASLTWTAMTTSPSTTGGIAINTYILEYKKTSAGTTVTGDPNTGWATAGVFGTTSATVSSLTNSTSYDFRISATNAVGTGPVSGTVSATPTASSVTPPTIRGWAYRENPTNAPSTTVNITPGSTVTTTGGFTTLPQGGDLLVLVLFSFNQSTTTTPSPGLALSSTTGWTLNTSGTGGGVAYSIYTRTAAGTAGAPTSQANIALTNGAGIAFCFAIQNGSPAIDVTSFNGTTTGSNSTGTNVNAVGTAVTPTLASDLLISIAHVTNCNSFSSTAFGTQLRSSIAWYSGGPAIGMSYNVRSETVSTGTSSTGTRTFVGTVSTTGTQAQAVLEVAIK